MNETETRAELDRAVTARNSAIWAGVVMAVGLRLYAHDGVGRGQFLAALAAVLLVLFWHGWHWRKVVVLRKQLGLDWRGRPVA